jgi:hypothetical protein
MLFPGNIYAHVMDKQIEPSDKFSLSYPISFFFGHQGGLSSGTSSTNYGNLLPLENIKHYITQITCLAKCLKEKLPLDRNVQSAGLVMTGLPWSDSSESMDLLEKALQLFEGIHNFCSSDLNIFSGYSCCCWKRAPSQ